jgi:hypothetical protein
MKLLQLPPPLAYGEWQDCFAFRPHITIDSEIVWLEVVQRRKWHSPLGYNYFEYQRKLP